MSVKIMSAVWNMPDLDASERLVMLSLADHADDQGRCYPSIRRLCERTSMSDRGVQKVLGRLIERGFLSVRPNAGQGGANLYLVATTPAGMVAPPNDVHPERRSPPRTVDTTPPNHVRKTPEPGSPKPSGTIIEPSIEGAPRRRRKPEVPIPEGWVPNEKNLEDARKLNLTEQEIRHEASQFRDRHLAKGSLFSDWDAAWRTWLGNIGKFSGLSMAGKAAPGGRGPGRSLASIVAERRIADADGRGFADQGKRDW